MTRKSTTLAQRRSVIHEADVARTTASQIQDRCPPSDAARLKMNVRLPGRYYVLLDTISARRASRPSRNALIGEAIELLLRQEGVL